VPPNLSARYSLGIAHGILGWRTSKRFYSRSPFLNNSGSRAMLTAIRRAKCVKPGEFGTLGRD
jgi:hypothetical protein